MKFSLCIEPFFEDIDFYDRIKLAASFGVDAIEFWDPTPYDCAKIGRIAAQEKIGVAICCAGNAWGHRLNEDSRAVIDYIKECIPRIKDMGCNAMIGLSGDVEGRGGGQSAVLVENLKRLAGILEKEEMTLCLEALNSIKDHKGYYLDSSYEGFAILKAVDSPRVKLLYDVYHMQLMEGNIIANTTKNIARIGHFHSAGVPGRGEHHLGELDYRAIAAAIEKAGYGGYFGLEYFPSYDNKKSLADVMNYFRK
jgi:hydroxypyruvate isomerase